ncbi:MAG: flavodoxin family protein [Promethearchaeota archaeon]
MKILGMIGSARKRGNCEILVKNSLINAQEQGAEIRAIRLPDFHLLPCKGCLACVLKGEPCRLDDDMHELWEHLQWADGVILSAPTYFLGPAGIIKLFIDRLFEYSLQLGTLKQRPGAIIATAGLREWDPFTLPMLSMLAGILRLNLIDRFIAYRPGPGEVLLDDETMQRTELIGKNLVAQIKEPSLEVTIPSPSHACPQCGTPFFQFRKDNLIECQLCQTSGIFEQRGESVSISWSPREGEDRWSPKAMAEHFSEWVLRTGPVYQKLRQEVERRIPRYGKIPIVSRSKKGI